MKHLIVISTLLLSGLSAQAETLNVFEVIETTTAVTCRSATAGPISLPAGRKLVIASFLPGSGVLGPTGHQETRIAVAPLDDQGVAYASQLCVLTAAINATAKTRYYVGFIPYVLTNWEKPQPIVNEPAIYVRKSEVQTFQVVNDL